VTQNRCKTCVREINRASYRAGTSRTRSYDGVFEASLRRHYGLTLADYEQMLTAQEGRCAVCGGAETVLRRTGEPYRLAVDHDHRSGQVRGLLCRRCNQIVWAFEEHSALLDQVVGYLAR
jgi:uncharacterized protein with PIN domain